MIKLYTHVVRALFLTMLTTFFINAKAQTTIDNTVGTTNYTAGNGVTGNSVVTFVVENSSSSDILLQQVGSYFQTASNNATVTLWYSSSSLSGVPTVATPAWTSIATGTISVTANGVVDCFSGLSFLIPGGAQYRFALQSSASIRYSGATPVPSPSTVTGGGVSLKSGDAQIAGANVGYGGAFPTPPAANTPRWFTGRITFGPAAVCTTPPTAGASTASPATTCNSTPVSLSLTGNSSGTGQTYIWQRSTNLTPPHSWTNISTSSSASTYITNATATAFYRAAVTCSGVTTYSDSVKVTVNPGFAGGTYSINGGMPTGGNNFQTFTDAVAALSCGIAGPIVFNVEPMTYNEQVVIPSIAGTSTTNTITFKGNLATISFNSSNAANRTGITLNGTDHVIIDSLNIEGAAGTYGWGILLTNQADSNIIRNCTINVSTSNITSGNHTGIILNGSTSVASTSGNNGNGNLIENNKVTGGYYGIYLYGSTAPYNLNNIVRNNIVNDFYYYSIYNYGQQFCTVSGNDISRPTRTTYSSYNLYISTNNGGIKIEKNRIHDLFQAGSAGTTILYNIYIGASGTAANVNSLENNLVYNINNSNGTIYGVYGLSYNYWNLYHNTIVLDDPNSTAGITYALYFYGTTATNVRNNIIYVSRGGSGTKYCLYYSTTGVTSSNNNVLYMGSTSGTNGIGYYNAGKTTLADWQTTGYDLNSSSANPLFTGGTDYTPTENSINNIGAAGLGVTTDITGAARAASPDPGAYEFTVAGIDGSLSWVAPTSPTTTGLKTITVKVTNNSSAGNITSANVSYTDGSTVQTQNFSGLNIAPSASQNISFTTQYNIAGNVNFTAYINTLNGAPDLTQANDTARQAICFSLNGSYTINQTAPASATNFASFGAVITALSCGGVSGPVVFNVVPGSGPYAERIVLPQFNGASAVNTVTIKGNLETLSYNTSDGNSRAALLFNGADYVTVDSLNIDVSAGTFGWGVALTNGADNNTVRGCYINIGNFGSSSTNYLGIILNGSATATAFSGNNGNGNRFLNNTINGGYYGFYMYGNSASQVQNNNNIIRGNTIQNSYSYSVYGIYQSTGFVVDSNDISRPNRTVSTTTAGAFITTNTFGAQISRNRIHNMFDAFAASTSTFYGIYMGADSKAGAESKVINNVVYNINGNGAAYGIYNTGADSMQAYHNTVVLDDPSTITGAAYGIYQTTAATGIDIRNNLIYIARNGTGIKRALYYATTTATIISNNNLLYFNPTAGTDNYLGQYGTTTYAGLSNWKTANGNAFDQVSRDADPAFVNAGGGDFTPTNSLAEDFGASVGVTTDINNTVRSTGSPDAGAFEVPPTNGIDLKIETLVSPAVATAGCYNSETITVRIRNNSTSTHEFSSNPATVTVAVTGAATATYTTVINTGSLASGAVMNVTVQNPSSTLAMTTNGVYDFGMSVAVTGDVNTANNNLSATREKIPLAAGVADALVDSYCLTGGKPVLKATGVTGFNNLQWQESTSPTTGFTTIAGLNTNPDTVMTNITQKMYYRLVASCGATTTTSLVDSVLIISPQLLSTTPGFNCNTGTVNLSATASSGATVKWYAAATGGAELASGNNFTTPSLGATTTYYATASTAGGSSGASPILITEMDLGTTTDQLEIQNVTGVPVDVTGWKVAISNSYTVITDVNANIQTLSGTMAPGETKTWTDLASATNYWGSNILWNPAQQGWAAILDNNNNLVDIVFIDWPAAAIQSASITIAGNTITPGTKWSGNGVNVTTAPDGQSVSRLGNMDNDNLSDFSIIPFTIGSTNPNLTLPFSGFGCEASRVAVTATIGGCNPAPVTLISFSGERRGSINKLTWSTASETNNNGFELQRSIDGRNFNKISFTKTKADNGNSNVILNYAFNDEQPANGNDYYRLKQIDRDGKYQFSNIVLIKGDKVQEVMITVLYPNPAKNLVNLKVVSPTSEKAMLIITDGIGKTVVKKAVSLVPGDNYLQQPVEHLAQGSYAIKIICDSGCALAAQKFVKE